MDCTTSLQAIALASRSVADLVAFGRAAIETAGTFDQVRDVRDQAEALRVFQRAQGAAQEAIDAAVEIKIRAERRMGEELRRAEKARPGPAPEISRADRPISAPRLAEVGITRDQSSRYQKLAATPEPVLNAVIAAHQAQSVPLTSASVRRATKVAAERSWSPADIKANPLPTAREARQQAREKGISVIARDGKLHDGRTLAEERADGEAVQRAESILHELEAIVEIIEAGMTPRAYFDAIDLPHFGRVADDDLQSAWAKVWPWFSEFNGIWERHRAAG